MRALGIDCGDARIGVALSDDERKMALPFCTVPRERTLDASARAVASAVADREVAVLVVGLPLRLDGTEGHSSRRARALGDAIGEVMGLPPIYWDERLTTAEAERALREQGISGRKRRQVIDQSAAAILLQSWIDSKSERLWDEDVEPLVGAAPRRGDGRRSRRTAR